MDGELKTVLGLVVGKLDQVLASQKGHDQQLTGLRADVSVLQAGMSTLQADVSTLQADVSLLKTGQRAILEHLDVAELKGRVEEQSRTIASLIPTRVAAIPGR